MEELKKENEKLFLRERDLVKENRQLETEFTKFRLESEHPITRPFSPVLSTIPTTRLASESPTRALRELEDYKEK